jgi:hypothetical protein
MRTKNFDYAYSELKLDRYTASKALHAAKKVAGLRGDDDCEFDLATGDILFNDEIIGNLGHP